MEQLVTSSIQNFNFVELLCFFIISRGLSKMEAMVEGMRKLNASIEKLEKRIENIEKNFESREER